MLKRIQTQTGSRYVEPLMGSTAGLQAGREGEEEGAASPEQCQRTGLPERELPASQHRGVFVALEGAQCPQLPHGLGLMS